MTSRTVLSRAVLSCAVVLLMALSIVGLATLLLSHAQAQSTQPPDSRLAEQAALPPLAQEGTSVPPVPTPEGGGPWVVRAYYDHVPPEVGRQMVDAVAAWAEPWEVDRKRGYLVVDVTRAEYDLLLEAGFRLEIDERLTAQLDRPNVRLAGQTAGIPGYPCYRTVEETYNAAQAIVAAHPDLATWVDVGDSWEKTDDPAQGYDLMVLRLTHSAVPGPKPKLFVMASVHAREYTPAELVTRFAEYLVDGYGLDADLTWLLDYHEVHLLLQANPDGRKQAEAGLSWRKNTNQNYCSPTSNDRGADLNRNFPFQWGCCGGSSGWECDETYRGPSPASEPETQAVESYLRAQFPDQREDDLGASAPLTATGVFVDVHSYSELVLWPWGFARLPAPNGAALRTLGRKLAYWNGYEPLQAVDLYPVDGATDDFAYGELGLAAYTFELGTAFFQDCAAFENTILPDNLSALLYAAKVVRTPYLTPAGPDALDGSLAPSSVAGSEVTHLNAVIDDTRYNNENGNEPLQEVAAAEYYVDIPPWITTTTPLAYPMAAVDGALDGMIEEVEATIDTADLSVGRHTIFVRGRDTDGNWGAFSAVFLYILDPATAPLIEGYVRQAGTGAPLEATITAGAFQTDTVRATGYYSMRVVSGTYDLSAVAAGHAVSTVTGIVAHEGQAVRQDFDLYPTCEVLTDDVESGNLGWTAQSPWAISGEAWHSASHSWTDSPGSDYDGNRDVSLTSPVFDLSAMSGVTLHFWHIYDLEADYDWAHVEVSTDAGVSWTGVASYSGYGHTAWTQEEISLSMLDRQPEARLRFRLSSDRWMRADGWHIDDIVLAGGGPPCLSQPYDLLVEPSSASQVAPAGTSVTYTLRITNAGYLADGFSLALSGNRWTTQVPGTVGPLEAEEGNDAHVVVAVPADAMGGESDSVTVTVTSLGDPTRTADSTLTTTVGGYTLFLPTVMGEP